MAQLKDTVVTGNLRVTNKIVTDSLQLTSAKTAVTGRGTTGSTDGSTYYPSKWIFDMGVTLQDGIIVTIVVPVAGHANGVYVSVDNGTTYKPVVIYGTTILTTHYTANMPMVLIYDEDATTGSMAPLNGGAKAAQTGGAWRFLNFYDSNNAVIQYINTDNANRPLLMANYPVGSTSTSAASVNRAQTIYANASTGTITATAFSGDHKGTINSATTATTQSQGDNSTKVATTAYVDTALGSISDTTYTLASGTNNGTLKLTPSSGSAQDNIAVTGWNNMATKTYVDDGIAHFKGSFDAFTGKVNGSNSDTFTTIAESIGDAYVCNATGQLYNLYGWGELYFNIGDQIVFKNAVAAGTDITKNDFYTIKATDKNSATFTTFSPNTITKGQFIPPTDWDTLFVFLTDGTFNTLAYSNNAFNALNPIIGVANKDMNNTGNIHMRLSGTVTIEHTQALTGVNSGDSIYVKGNLVGNVFTVASATPLTKTTPSTDDGFYYIYLGYAVSSTQMFLTLDHPIYAYKNGKFSLIAEDPQKLPLTGGTMTGAIQMNDNTIHFGSQSQGCYAARDNSNGTLTIMNYGSSIEFEDPGDITVSTPAGDTTLYCGTNKKIYLTGNTQITGNTKITGSGEIIGTLKIGSSSATAQGELSVDNSKFSLDYQNSILELASGSSKLSAPNITIEASGVLTLKATTWTTSSGTTAVITSDGTIKKQSSSKRYKDKIDYNIDREKYHTNLMQFNPCTYIYKSEPDKKQLGLIAEDVELINKDLCLYDDTQGGRIDNYKDRDIIAILILEAQRKDKEIQELKAEIEKLKNN